MSLSGVSFRSSLRRLNPRSVGGLWRLGGSVVAVAMVTFGALNLIMVVAHESFTEHEDFDAADITRLEVHNSAGRVHVVGGAADLDTVNVRAEIADGLQHTRHDRSVDEAGTLHLDGSCPPLSDYCRVDYTVEIPPELDVEVRAEQRVSLQGVAGNVDVSSEDSGVEAEALSGDSVQLRSGRGSVEATGLSASTLEVRAGSRAHAHFSEPPQHVELRSGWSSAELVLPDDGDDYRIEASSSWGSVDTTTMRIDPDSERSLTVRSGASVTVRYE